MIRFMNFKQVIQAMMDEGGFNGTKLSRTLGKTPGYIAATLSRGSTPRLDTFIQIAKAMGYEVQVVKSVQESHIVYKIDSAEPIKHTIQSGEQMVN